jgi:hypothetical protein
MDERRKKCICLLDVAHSFLRMSKRDYVADLRRDNCSVKEVANIHSPHAAL